MFWYEKYFKENTQEDNYKFLLEMILNQMDYDCSDYMWRDYKHQGVYIQYFLDNLEQPYRERVFKHISPEILKSYILDVAYGFGDGGDSETTRFLFYKICGSIIEELYGCGYAKKDSD